jgi:hypothetical protein
LDAEQQHLDGLEFPGVVCGWHETGRSDERRLHLHVERPGAVNSPAVDVVILMAAIQSQL